VPLSLFSNKRLSRMGIRMSMVGIFNFDPNMNNLNNKDWKLKINTGYPPSLTAIFFRDGCKDIFMPYHSRKLIIFHPYRSF
jgi:hypothetical protein